MTKSIAKLIVILVLMLSRGNKAVHAKSLQETAYTSYNNTDLPLAYSLFFSHCECATDVMLTRWLTLTSVSKHLFEEARLGGPHPSAHLIFSLCHLHSCRTSPRHPLTFSSGFIPYYQTACSAPVCCGFAAVL